MPEECNSLIGGNFAKICGYTPKSGIRRKWYLNLDDIDKAAITYANKKNLVTALTLLASKKVYEAKGNDKSSQLQATGVVGDFGNGYKHTDVLNVIYRGAAERERISEFSEGARVVTIVEKVDQGENGELAFEIAGLESGMLMSDFQYDTNANSGVATLTVATKDGEEEATPPKILLLTDYATTLAFLETNTFDPTA